MTEVAWPRIDSHVPESLGVPLIIGMSPVMEGLVVFQKEDTGWPPVEQPIFLGVSEWKPPSLTRRVRGTGQDP